jgi:chaperonin GroES
LEKIFFLNLVVSFNYFYIKTQNVMSAVAMDFSTITLKPIADRVVVRRVEAEERTKGGIIIPDTAKEKPQRGEVIAVGPGKEDHKMTVKVGDQILFGKYAGQELELDGEELLIMREDDILVVLG